MRHESASKRLSEYLDGTLPSWQRGAVSDHLSTCADCRRELLELRRTVQLLRRLEPEEPPEGLAARVTARVMAEMPRPWSTRLREMLSSGASWGAPLATAGVGLALLAIVQNVEVEVNLPWLDEGAEPASVTTPAPVQATSPGAIPVAQPLRVLRQPEMLVGASQPAPAAKLPPLGACWNDPSREACVQYHSWLVGLAMHDPPAFLAEIDEVPSPSRERWLGAVSRFAASSGASPLVASSLHQIGDPRAERIAPRFERVAAGIDR